MFAQSQLHSAWGPEGVTRTMWNKWKTDKLNKTIDLQILDSRQGRSMITERGKVNEVVPVYSQDILASRQIGKLEWRLAVSQSWRSRVGESRDIRPAEFTRPYLLHLEHGSKNRVLEVIQRTDSGCSGLDSSVCSLLNWAIQVSLK